MKLGPPRTNFCQTARGAGRRCRRSLIRFQAEGRLVARQFIAPELTGQIAPTRLEGINLRGIFRFPTERYAAQILPSQTLPKILASA
jgi:hypothetical protein